MSAKNDDTTGATTARRGLMRGAGIGAAALAVSAFGFTPRRAMAQALSDTDYLNFALNLEYLEAEFYLRAVYGVGLGPQNTSGVGARGTVTGGKKVMFTSKAVQQYATEIAQDERNHVLFLRSVLGSLAVAEPSIDLDTSFTMLARSAGIIGPNQTFSPFTDDNSFLVGAFIFEDVGVTAYNGAITALVTPAYISAAASIMAVEAYHASEVRLQCLQNGLSYPVDKISALRAALSDAADDQGVLLNGNANIVPADSNSLAFIRDPAQVLNVVYGGGAANDYLFYPDKMNGAIS
jgi:hypothetical protein